MGEDNQFPIPDESGSSGTQKEADDSSEPVESKPLEGLFLGKAMDGLMPYESKSLSLGSKATRILINGITKQLLNDLNEQKNKNNILSEKFDTQRDELEKCRVSNAGLKGEIRAEKQYRNLKHVCIALGTGTIIMAVNFYLTDGLIAYGFGSTAVGAILLYAGLFSGPKETLQ